MSTHNEHELKAYRARLLSLLTRVRNAPDLPSMDADFYIVLGWISARPLPGRHQYRRK